MLAVEAGVRVRDSTSLWRMPYWQGQTKGGQLRVFTGGLFDAGSLKKAGPGKPPTPSDGRYAMDRVVIAPAPWLYLRKVHRCCGFGQQSCRMMRCELADWRSGRDCCPSLYPRMSGKAEAYPYVKLCWTALTKYSAYNMTGSSGWIQHLKSNCSHFQGIFRPIPDATFEDAPGASCVLREPPEWLPAFRHSKFNGSM